MRLVLIAASLLALVPITAHAANSGGGFDPIPWADPLPPAKPGAPAAGTAVDPLERGQTVAAPPATPAPVTPAATPAATPAVPAAANDDSVSPQDLQAVLKALPGLPQPPTGTALPALPTTAATKPAAPTGPPPPPGSVPDLANSCNLGLLSYQSGNPDVNVGQCSGFIDAVLQDMKERRDAGEKTNICITGHVTEMGIIRLFTSWAERHPEPIFAWDGIHKAMAEAYPCGK